MSTLLIANNCTRENGSFMGDQLCALKTAYLFIQNQYDVDKVIMSMSPENEMSFLWQKFIDNPRGDGIIPPVEIVYDNWNPGDWNARWSAWDKWRIDRTIEGRPFHHYRELYLRIHGAQRQTLLCGLERGLGRRNIYEYWFYGQENTPSCNSCVGADWFDDTLVYHPPHLPERDVYISPHCKTQGNYVFTFDYWSSVVHKLVEAGVTVTVGYDGYFCEDLQGHPFYKKYWGDHKQWMEEICRHKIVACGNTGTGWLAAACGVPLFTMEPPNSQMPDHRYRECGLRNLVEVMDSPDADYCARRLIEEVRRTIVMTTGCYDVIHAGHVRHLERSKAMGTRLVVALNSDESIRRIKGPNRPINPQAQRKSVLESLRCVDEVRIFDGDDATDVIKELKPDILTNGYGYTLDKIVGREIVEGYGGRVAVTCHSDAKDEPSTTKILSRVLKSGDIVEICRLGAAYSVNPFDKLRLMAEEFLKVANLPGDIADLGTYRGGTSLILRRLSPDKNLHLFDTWAGNPFDDEMCHHKKGEWSSSLDDCKLLVGEDKLTHYHQGVFPNVLPDVFQEFCFVYVDVDTYQSTKDAIDFFWPHIVPGGKMFFDDYGWEPCAGVKKAVDQVLSLHIRERATTSLRVIQSHFTCVVTK
jgi:rfaE bifunctional protein nucleotidyltransferase chain/domain